MRARIRVEESNRIAIEEYAKRREEIDRLNKAIAM